MKNKIIFGYDKIYNGIPEINGFPNDYENNIASVTLGWKGYEYKECEIHIDRSNPPPLKNRLSVYNEIKYFQHAVGSENFLNLPIQDIEENYYIPIRIINHLGFAGIDYELAMNPVFSDMAVNDLQKGKAKILLINHSEVFKFTQKYVDIFKSWIDKYNLPDNSIVLISGSYDYDDFIKPMGIRHITFNFWESVSCDIFQKHNFNKNIFKIMLRVMERKKKFLCYNRTTSESRIKIFNELYHRDLLKHGMVSFGIPWGNYIKYVEKYSTVPNFMDMIPIKINETDDLDNRNKCTMSIIKENFLDSYFSVVTDTWHQDYQNTFLTEKIFKAVLCFHPILLVSSLNALNQLKKIGYETFSKWFDESYDECDNIDKRISIIVDEVSRLCKMSNRTLGRMLLDMKPVLCHNFNNIMINQNKNKKDLVNELSGFTSS